MYASTNTYTHTIIGRIAQTRFFNQVGWCDKDSDLLRQSCVFIVPTNRFIAVLVEFGRHTWSTAGRSSNIAPFSDWYQNVPIFQNVPINRKVHFARSVHFERSVPKCTDLSKCTDFIFRVEIVQIPNVQCTDLSKCTIDMHRYIFRNPYILKDRYILVPIFQNILFSPSVRSDHQNQLLTLQRSIDLLENQKSDKHFPQTTTVHSELFSPSTWK